MTKNSKTNRRQFMSKSAAAAAGGIIAANTATAKAAGGFHVAGDGTIKVGLIGCGGRGTGAAVNACRADPNVRITALADAFSDRIESVHKTLTKKRPGQLAEDVQKFAGFDNYKDLIDSGVDIVILATPPHFRPAHIEAAIQAGKHVFCEKPVGVDVPGVQRVREACRRAADQGLTIVSGLCWRYDVGVRATMERIQNGAIGEILSIQENYLTSELWHRGENPKWSQMEYQMRNWLYFNWLAGDHTAEQHIHSIDKSMWLMGDQPPVRCYAMGGRQKRTGEQYGNVYDHFATVFEWANGVKCHSYCRQQEGCFNDVEDYVIGTKGKAIILRHEILADGKEPWRFTEKKPSMYDVELQEMIAAICNDDPINNGEYMCDSTLMALIARDCAYTGQSIEWADYLKSEVVLGPKKYGWGDYEPLPVAIPGEKVW